MNQAAEAIDSTRDIDPVHEPTVRVVITAVVDADLDAAIASIRRQAYDRVVDVAVIRPATDMGEGVTAVDSLEEAIASTDASVDYMWIVHADARPRPDALTSLVREVERHEAGLGASKLLRAGSKDELEEIGSATDVFGEPFSGLDEGEVDLQQYDVVREVSYVHSVSMLVRRDLARGLGGLDTLLPPSASGLDFSQRARLAGGRVIIVPSSEVYHQGKCSHTVHGWRERAGRMRSMWKAYRPLTLAWVVPLSLLVGLLDSLLNLVLLRWRPFTSYLATWGWNLMHLPSTWSARRRANAIRSVGDEELFRFQTSGSVRMRDIGIEFSDRALSLFDDDQALTRGVKRVWSSSGSFGALIAVFAVIVVGRGILLSGVPNTGMSFPFEPSTVSLQRFLGGWNEAGLGSPAPVHPLVGLTGLASLVWFGTEGAARTVFTFGFGVVGVIGMGRLLGRLGVRGSGRYLAGLVMLAGPGTAALTGRGSWSALAAAAALPWAVRSVFVHPAEEGRGKWAAMGWALLIGWLIAAISPVLLVVPILAALMWSVQGGRRARLLLALASAVGGVAAASFLSGDPGWVLDSDRRLGVDVSLIWPGAMLLAAVPLFVESTTYRRVANIGALLGLGGLVLWGLGLGGPGVEEAALVTASAGAAILTGVGLDRWSLKPLPIVSALGGLIMVGWSISTMLGGNLGLPAGDVNDDLIFAESLADSGEPRRVLYASDDASLVPGEARPGPGYWYRVLDGSGTTIDEVWLPPERSGDRLLEERLTEITTGSNLRPGSLLSEFGIGWIVIEGPENRLDKALATQFDIIPVPFDSSVR
ncbi:MAG: hypothetical protein OEM32_07190, partial [Acidimicrobiia bacterium]|nr:hypothetical protein [Acidimicrobiia bacterium]